MKCIELLLDHGADKEMRNLFEEYPIDCLPFSADSLDTKKISNLLYIKNHYVYDEIDFNKYNTMSLMSETDGESKQDAVNEMKENDNENNAADRKNYSLRIPDVSTAYKAEYK